MKPLSLSRRASAEALGTGLLVAAVIGSGIMAVRLSEDNVLLQLLANTLATGAALLALIMTIEPISGAHFNPAVTLANAVQNVFPWREAPIYVAAQLFGGLAGALLAHLMFAAPLFSVYALPRSGLPQLVSELVATFGLVSVIFGCTRRAPRSTPFAVAAYIAAAYWFTASTSFANPAVTLARAVTSTFAGIRFADVPGFVAAQLVGAGLATLLFRWLLAEDRSQGDTL